MSRRSIAVLACAVLFLSSCSSPVDDAPAVIRAQYLQVARIAGEQAGMRISDADWLELARTVCERRILNSEEYAELVEEMETGAPNPAVGRAVRDVGQTAIQLFCPVD